MIWVITLSCRIFRTEFVLTDLQLMQNLSPVTSGPYCMVIFIIPSPDWRMQYIWHLRPLHRVTFCSIYRNHTARNDWIKPLDFWPCDRIALSLISHHDIYPVVSLIYVMMVTTNLLLFIFVFSNAFNNRICSEQKALSLMILYLSVRDPC